MTSSLTGKGTRKRRNRVSRVLIFSIMCLIGAGMFLVGELIIFSQAEDRLPSDIIAGQVAIGGMTPNEAQVALEQAYAQPITLYYGESPIVLEPASVGFRVNWQTMIAQAISAGQAEGSFWRRFFNHLTREEPEQTGAIPLIADYQQNLLEQFLRDVSQRYDQRNGDAGFDLSTLTTFSDAGGFVLDLEAAMVAVDQALREPRNRTVNLPTGSAQGGRPSLATLEELIIDYLDSQGFIYDGQTTVASIFIVDLLTGEEINLLGDVSFTAASTTKVAIMMDYFRILSRDPSQDEAWLMANSLLCSRNSSSNLLMTLIGQQNIFNGIASVTETAQRVGARNTYLTAPFVEGDPNQELGSIAPPQINPNPNFNTGADPFNQTTAEDMGTVFSMIYDCANYGSGLMAAYPEGEFTQQECQRMLNLMSANDLQRLLQGGIPEGVTISHKNGWLTDMVGDAGIVFSPNGRDYIISVFLWEEAEFQDFTRLWPILEGVSRATWNYFNPEAPLLTARNLPTTAEDCEGNYLPPGPESVNLDDINWWR